VCGYINVAVCCFLTAGLICHLSLIQVFEKFTKESTSLLDELIVINENEKGSQAEKDRYFMSHHPSRAPIMSSYMSAVSRATVFL